MNCSRCGAEAGGNAAFCPKCGTALGGTARPADLGSAIPASSAPAAPAAGRGGAAYSFNASRWTSSDRIAGGATLIVLIALFLPWYSVNLAGLSDLGITSGTATASGTTAHGWLWFVFVIGLLTLLYLVISAGFQQLPVTMPLRHDRLLLAATGLDLLLVVIAFVLKPGNDGIAEVKIGWAWGAFVALIAAIAAVVPLARAALAEQTAAQP